MVTTNFIILLREVQTSTTFNPYSPLGLEAAIRKYKQQVNVLLMSCVRDLDEVTLDFGTDTIETLCKLKFMTRQSLNQLTQPSYKLSVPVYRPIGIFSNFSEEEKRVNDEIRHTIIEIYYDALSYLLNIMDSCAQLQSTDGVMKEDDHSCNSLSEKRESKVIGGVRELAKYLGIGVTKAQEIVNSKVLEKEGVSYCIGRKWLFNKEKLDALVREKPDVFSKSYRKHIR